MSAQPVPVPQTVEVVFRVRRDESGEERPFPDMPSPELHVNDSVVYKSPDGAVELKFVTFDDPAKPASPFADGSTNVRSKGKDQATELMRLGQAGHFFCFCKIVRADGTVVEWKKPDPAKGHGADHDILPPRP